MGRGLPQMAEANNTHLMDAAGEDCLYDKCRARPPYLNGVTASCVRNVLRTIAGMILPPDLNRYNSRKI